MVDDLAEAKAVLAGAVERGVTLLAEAKVPFVRELSAQVARSPHGQAAAYPVVESLQIDGICREVYVPAPGLSEAAAVEAQRIALTVAKELGVTGMLAVEMFETADGSILINELAMRPHNSGHWSMDGAVTGQFEQHLRAVLDLPLGAGEAGRAGGGDGQRAGAGPARGLPRVQARAWRTTPGSRSTCTARP